MRSILKKLGIVLAIVAVIVAVIYVLSGETDTGFDGTKGIIVNNMVDIGIRMERDLGVEDVMINEVDGGVLEVRVKAPDGADKETLSAGAAYMFGYLEPMAGEGSEKIRVIYTADNLDSSIFEAVRSDILLWKNREISDDDFALKIKYADLKK